MIDYTGPPLSDLPVTGGTGKAAKGLHGDGGFPKLSLQCPACNEHHTQPSVRSHRPRCRGGKSLGERTKTKLEEEYGNTEGSRRNLEMDERMQNQKEELNATK